jgi:ubiquinone/menaquinone biosynthesis C-methylase UbiE
MLKGLKNKTEYVKSKYDRVAPFYDFYELFAEILFFKRWRKLAVSKLKGSKVLEVGAGTGKNFPYYPRDLKALATDISEKMIERAEKRAAKLNLPIKLEKMDAQRLLLKENSFDSALSTFVFCSVPDPVKGLKEIKRVLKKDGVAVFLEHVRPSGFLGKIFDFLNPFIYRATGVNINRDTVRNIQKAGFKIVEDRNLLLGIFKLITAKPS